MDENELDFTILDLSGKIVKQTEIPVSAGSQKLDIAMPDVANGMYYYRCTTSNKVFIGKFLKN
ncbi:MAG: T9SS type A sorting domain-containing protein [Chitinophagaceae bacterium]